MHAVVMESLEEYLSGLLDPAERRRIEAHLHDCPGCRAGIDGMTELSSLFGVLQNQECEPAPGFYSRVVERIEAASAEPSFASLFAFDLVFARRLDLPRLQEVFWDIVLSKRRHLAHAGVIASACAKRRSTKSKWGEL